MSEIERLPNSLTVQYSELMQNCIHPLSDGSNISFKAKTIHGKRYWYLYISLGSSRREHYLGEETPELLDRIEDERELWESNADDRTLRARLVATLIAGGMAPVARDEGKLLTLLERSGVFLAGGVLVGSVAFKAYGNMLGVRWSGNLQTQDVDIAADNRFTLALPRPRRSPNLRQVIMDSGLGFFEVPALDRHHASTSYKIRNKDFRIDVLAPMIGRETRRPVKLEHFDTYAQPVRHLDYLLQDIQPAVLLFEHGIMVNTPSPGRFAIHKCATSRLRPAAMATKAKKDIQQAGELFQVLIEDRPGDILFAYEAAARHHRPLLRHFRAGLNVLDQRLRHALLTLVKDA